MNSKSRNTWMLIAGLTAIGAIAVAYGLRHNAAAPVAGSSAPAASSAEAPLVLKPHRAVGVSFNYPEPYVVEVASDNPRANQIALSSHDAPGVLTIRLNTEQPDAPLELEQVAAEAAQGRGDAHDATVTTANLTVRGQKIDARGMKFSILGTPFTDVIGVVPIAGRQYVVTVHAADEDWPKASRMFQAVLSSIDAMK